MPDLDDVEFCDLCEELCDPEDTGVFVFPSGHVVCAECVLYDGQDIDFEADSL